jgi:hypothetical protein
MTQVLCSSVCDGVTDIAFIVIHIKAIDPQNSATCNLCLQECTLS